MYVQGDLLSSNVIPCTAFCGCVICINIRSKINNCDNNMRPTQALRRVQWIYCAVWLGQTDTTSKHNWHQRTRSIAGWLLWTLLPDQNQLLGNAGSDCNTAITQYDWKSINPFIQLTHHMMTITEYTLKRLPEKLNWPLVSVVTDGPAQHAVHSDKPSVW